MTRSQQGCRRAATERGHAIGPAAVEVVDLLIEPAQSSRCLAMRAAILG